MFTSSKALTDLYVGKYSLMSIYRQLSADNFERSWSLPSYYGLGRFHFKGRNDLQTVDTHAMFLQ